MKTNVKSLIRMILALALAFIMTLTLFACTEYKPNDGELPEGYVPEPSGKIKLNYYIAATEADKRSVNDWVAAFQNKYRDVTVVAELSNTNNIVNQIASKTCGDVFFLWEIDVYNYAAVQNVLMPLDSYIEAYEIDLSNIFNAIKDMGNVNGKTYMVMRDYNHLVFRYNRDIITSASLEDPIKLESEGTWTWDTFKEYCARLTTQEEDADVPTVGCSMRLGYGPVFIPFLEGWGGRWYDKENKRVNFISDSKVLEGVKEMISLVQSNVCKYNAAGGGGSIKETADQRSFGSYNDYNQVVFADIEFPSFGAVGKNYEEKGIDWDVVSLPAFPTHKVGTGATGFAVFNGTRNPEAAAALCLSLYTEEGQRAYNGQEGGSVPNVRSLADASFWRVPYADREIDPENGKNYFAFVSFPEADTYGRAECVVPPEIATIVNTYMATVVPDVVNGSKTVDDVLKKLEDEANQKWDALYND